MHEENGIIYFDEPILVNIQEWYDRYQDRACFALPSVEYLGGVPHMYLCCYASQPAYNKVVEGLVGTPYAEGKDYFRPLPSMCISRFISFRRVPTPKESVKKLLLGDLIFDIRSCVDKMRKLNLVERGITEVRVNIISHEEFIGGRDEEGKS